MGGRRIEIFYRFGSVAGENLTGKRMALSGWFDWGLQNGDDCVDGIEEVGEGYGAGKT
jgi:hypothetical protein